MLYGRKRLARDMYSQTKKRAGRKHEKTNFGRGAGQALGRGTKPGGFKSEGNLRCEGGDEFGREDEKKKKKGKPGHFNIGRHNLRGCNNKTNGKMK